VPQHTRIDQPFHRPPIVVEPSNKSDLELDAALAAGLYHPVAVVRVHRHWFLAEDLLACLCCGNDDFGMEIGGRAYHHRLDIRLTQ
jgi:hypothetical protein